MPWYIVLITIILAQAILIFMINDTNKKNVSNLKDQLTTAVESNERLSNALLISEQSGKSNVELAETIAKDMVDSERERYRIEAELCRLGWGDVVQTQNRRHTDVKEKSDETINPNDRFDDTISGLLKNAYDCATSGICVRPDPTVGSN